MHSKNKFIANTVYSNEAYEVELEVQNEDESGKEQPKGRNPSHTKVLREDSSYDSVDDFINVMDTQNEEDEQGYLKTSLMEISPKAHLAGIPEEVPSVTESSLNSSIIIRSIPERKVHLEERMNSRSENLSQSNYSGDETNRNNGHPALKRDSHINIKDIQQDIHIQIGSNYRKTSNFVISPRFSNNTHTDCMKYNAGNETYDIKLLDNKNIPELFIEFDSLQYNRISDKYYWVEKSRWLRYEEYYNPDLNRFDNPHLSPLSVRGISVFRKLFAKGEVVLNCHEKMFSGVLKNVSDSISKSGTFTSTEIIDIRNALVLKHYHAGDVLKDSLNETSTYRFDKEAQCLQSQTDVPLDIKQRRSSFIKFDINQRRWSNARLDGRLGPDTEAMSVQVGALETLQHTFLHFIRLDPPIITDGLNEVNCPLRFIFILFGPKSKEEDLLEVGRVFSVMMSNPEFREVGYSANCKEDFIEATKIFVNHSVLVPFTKVITIECLAAMLPQMKHYANHFLAEKNKKIFDEIKKDIINNDQEVTMNQYDDGVHRRISFKANLLSEAHQCDAEEVKKLNFLTTSDESTARKKLEDQELFSQFCPPFYHFMMDWKGLKTRYANDYRDAFKSENISVVFIGIIFIYFVVLSPAITFGALLNEVNPKMTVSLMLVASGFYQFTYTLLSGQPLEVVGITGPVFVVEKVLGSLAISFDIELEVMRFWIGIYVAILGLMFTIFNGVVIIKHFRRSVEEVYNFLVAAIFILSAFFSMFKALPYTMTPLAANGTNIDIIFQERLKFGLGGTTLFLAFFMANFCVILVKIKRGSFFRRQIRNLLGSFNVPLGIILIFSMERIFFKAYNLPTLNVPPSNVINVSLWFNTPVFANVDKATLEVHGFCFLISLSLFAILVTEVSTNSISTTKTERKLVKPSLYSLNYFYVIVIFPLVSAITGWPFVSGAMVRSNAHCMAMSKWSIHLPGVPSKVIGAIEQRVSGVLVGLLVLFSVFLGSILSFIPMASMYGMFLYMGIMGASDLVFMRRLICILQRRKYWGAEDYLKDYPTWNIGILIFFQSIFIGILIILNCISEFTKYSWVTLIFPLFVGLYAALRGYTFPKWPRLNSHLSKMDKKHPVKLYADLQASEHVLLTVDEKGINMKVIQTYSTDLLDIENDEISSNDNESVMDKYW